jgi:hypothetical protein
MRWLLFLLGSAVLMGQPTNITVQPLDVMAVVCFTAPDSADATVEITRKFTGSTPDFANPYPAYNTTLFPGSTTVPGPSRYRCVHLGDHGSVISPTNGWIYYKALEAYADQGIRVTTTGGAVTQTFRTHARMLGVTWSPTARPNPLYPGRALMPTWDWNDQSQEFIDPLFGGLVKKGSGPGRMTAETGHNLDSYDTLTGATGTNWTTPTAAISDADSNASAEYSAATKDWLHVTATWDVRYYWSIDKVGAALEICGEGVTTESREYEVALSLDADETPDSEVRTGVAVQISPGATCSTTEIMIPSDYTSKIFDRWRPMNQAQWGMYEIDSGTHSSSSGGIFNPNWGILIRKKSAAADGKILVQSVRRRLGVSINTGGFSGGFSEYCSTVLDQQGYYKCQFPTNGSAFQLFAVHPVTGEVKHLGSTTFSANLGVTWDTVDGDRWYTASPTQIITNKYAQNGVNYNVPPALGSSGANVTQTVMMINVQQAIVDWVAANRPDGFTFNTLQFGCSHAGVQIGPGGLSDPHLILECPSGNQDSAKWYAAIKLDPNYKVYTDGTTTTAVVGAYPMFRPSNTRWLNGHSYYQHTGGGVSLVGQIFKASNVDGGRHYYIKTLTPMTSGTTTIDIQSDAPNGESEPYGNDTGDVNKRFLQTLEVGDWINNQAGTEAMRVDSKTLQAAGPPKTWRLTITRAMSGSAQSYSANTYFQMWPNGGNPIWQFATDPHGLAIKRRIYGSSSHDDHATGYDGSPGILTGGDGEVVVCSQPDATAFCADHPANVKTRSSTWSHFNRKRGSKDGQGAEKHPSVGHEKAPTVNQRLSQIDLNPMLGLNWGAGGPASCDITVWNDTPGTASSCYTQRVPGTTNMYALKGQPLDSGTGEQVPAQPDWKYSQVVKMSGKNVMLDQSGPSTVLTDTTGDYYKLCNVLRDGECHATSKAGWVYFVVPNLAGTGGCGGGQFAAIPSDFCYGNNPIGLHTVNQVFFGPGTENGEGIHGSRQPALPQESATHRVVGAGAHRELASAFSSPRTLPATANARSLVDQSWLITPIFQSEVKSVDDDQRGVPGGVRWDWALTRIPPPPPRDSIRRDQFISVPVKLGGMPGADNAVVEFGYNSQFYCVGQWADTIWDGRSETCVKGDHAEGDYGFAGDTITGVSCASGCTVNVPAIPHRVLYFRHVYRNGTTVVARGEMQLRAVR